ncbi:inactive peptidyl-prolyl cis-trans isomerase FKBP6 [Genypterus blacodes]|uniref:inactive peptidyl-prolyl cis-trans isomerase FKBP6 n=1 Tax=Genypterus blacodes TaxID=154954 RepID=UPI003F770357
MASPFEQLRQRMQDISGDGGILKELIQPGDGPCVPHNASVLIHFSSFLDYSDQPFSTNTHHAHPRMMKLGTDMTLLGLELGLKTMCKGEFSRFLLQPAYAYGEMGCPPLIPPAATVLYEVQLIDFLDSGQVDDFLALSPEEQNTTPLSTLLDVANTIRTLGNRYFKRCRYDDAKDQYKQAMRFLAKRERRSAAEKESVKAALLPLYLNLSLTELRLESPNKALKYGDKALEIDAANTKALFRCGQAYMELQDYQNAQKCLLKAQASKPYNSDINNLLRTVAVSYTESLDKQKDLYSKMFRGE